LHKTRAYTFSQDRLVLPTTLQGRKVSAMKKQIGGGSSNIGASSGDINPSWIPTQG
jgi:hypothetical protein